MLDKNFNSKEFESYYYEKQQEKLEEPNNNSNAERYSIMMPPPNVTGRLHLGHALTYTLQDILIRYKRMLRKDVFWQPGTDHAGIATQMLVERKLFEETGKNRFDFSRDAFLKHVWSWKEESGNQIVEQQKQLGILPNWDQSRFTMDDGLCEAVRHAFVKLYDDGLIYKAERLVNWDPKLKTAISDLEVVSKEESIRLWYLRYSFVDSRDQHIVIATSRPETIFADQAIAVHPDDERYKSFIGQKVLIPLVNSEIPIIADEYCDIEKGSGAVKITPAHDFNDFEVGARHSLTLFNILDDNCCLNNNVPDAYKGLTVKEARKKILQALEEKEILEKYEDVKSAIPYGDRSNVRIESLLTKQWFLDTSSIAKEALEAVKNDKTSFIPKQWENTYFDWLKNIQPWCISRQLWWGHQIPAWYGEDGKIFVANTREEAYQKAEKHYGKPVELKQDDDVLDTWFSSALWPFSTLGWPNYEENLEKYYPTSTLITGFDIIFFWVARMVMMGLYFTKKVPFKHVYVHALVRDEKGQKMSKSKGNVIDPLELVEEFGVDSLRFALSFLSTPGRDIKIGKKTVEGHRHFITKIWNSARFLQMNDCYYDSKLDVSTVKESLSHWIIYEFNALVKDTSENLDNYRFDLYASTLHKWLWGTYCGQFLEALKVLTSDSDESTQYELKQVAIYIFLNLMKLLHPVIPMITEKLWDTFVQGDKLLMMEPWPFEAAVHKEKHKMFGHLFSFSAEIRSFKGILGIDPAQKLSVFVNASSVDLLAYSKLICALGQLNDLSIVKDISDKNLVPFVFDGTEAFVLLDDEMRKTVKDVVVKKMLECEQDAIRLEKKINNEAYKTAKPDMWQQDVLQYDEKKQLLLKLKRLDKEL